MTDAASPRMFESYRGTVYPWHCDHVGHMNVMWYVGKFDEASWQFLNSLGLSPDWLRKHGRGMVAVDQRIAYLRELHAGDVVTVRTAVLEVRDKVIRFAHELRDASDDSVCAVTQIVAAHLDMDARRACKLPEHIAATASTRVTRLALPWQARPA